MPDRNVLRVNVAEETEDYRRAVARMISSIQANDPDETHAVMADRLDISLGTISNAANKKADLNPLFLARFGKVYGPHVLEPFAALVGGRMVSKELSEIDNVVPLTLKVSHRLAEATAGGKTPTHQDILAAERDAIAAVQALSALVEKARQLRGAA